MIVKDICDFCIHKKVCSRKRLLKGISDEITQYTAAIYKEEDMAVEIQCDQFDTPINHQCVG